MENDVRMTLAETQNNTLPTFDAPPVHEVTLGIQFEAIRELRAIDLGDLSKIFPSGFSTIEEHPPLPPMFEIFGARVSPFGNMQFQIPASTLLPRLWVISDDQREVLGDL